MRIRGENLTRSREDRAGAPTINDAIFTALGRLLSPLRRAPWWLQVSVLFLAARLVSFAILLGAAWHAEESPWGGRQPDYLTFIDRWDAGWYERIFDGGYPTSIPRNDDGTAQPNQWAFYPVFPFLARGLSTVTGLGWPAAGALVATVAGLGAAFVIYLLFRRFASPGTALWGVAFFAMFPVSPVLQVPYAESLGLLFLAAALYLLIKENYWASLPMVVLLCLSRPAGVPFAAVVLVHLLLRWRKREQQPFPPRDQVAGVVLLVASGIMAFAWMGIAWWVTGERTAYTDTETAWRGSDLVLFKPWFDAGIELVGPFWGPLLPILFVALVALYLNSAAVRKIGLELRVWCAMYLLYLLAVLHPQSSTFRMLLPLFPLALAAALISGSRAYRWSVLVMFSVLQIVWVVWLWQFSAISTGQAWPP
ncbi:hypothetical protein [Arthrobacter psychrolactophilus]|uniref:hypothetical protein n=1 Tax=Arthrobacter psychrolactophilus TaxID=92442 RepID=UPI001FE43681|nr:hypothetical protein [Arthrobacter psychrolactophilus]